MTETKMEEFRAKMRLNRHRFALKAISSVPFSEWRYAHRRRSILKYYNREIDRAARTEGADTADDINSVLNAELVLLDDERDLELTQELRTTAARLSVAMPVRDFRNLDGAGMWRRCQSNEFSCLTPLGVETARAAIRKERSERQKMWAHWLSWFTALTSMVAAIASVFVALKKL